MYWHSNHARGFRLDKPSLKSILQTLCSRADLNGYCQLGYPKLAEEASVSISTAKRAVLVLEKAGHILVIRKRTSYDNHEPNKYLVFPTNPPIKPNKNDPKQTLGPSEEVGGVIVTPGSVKLTPLETNKEIRNQDTSADSENRIDVKNSIGGMQIAIQESKRAMAGHNSQLDFFTSCGVKLFDVAALPRKEGSKPPLIRLRSSVTAKDIIHANSLLQAFNNSTGKRTGRPQCYIFIRPARYGTNKVPIKHSVIFLDDIDFCHANIFLSNYKCAVIETSKDNYQAWIATCKTLNEHERHKLQKYLHNFYNADAGSLSGEHFGRLISHYSRKPDRNNFMVRQLGIGRGSLMKTEIIEDSLMGLEEQASVRVMLNTPKCSLKPINGGKDHSAYEYGYVINALKNGILEERVRENLIEQCASRRGADTQRYVDRTIAKAKAQLINKS